MQTKTRNLILLLALLSSFAALTIQSGRAYYLFQQSQPGTIAGYIEEAQAQNLSSITFDSGIHEYFIPSSWDEVLTGFSFLVVEPTELRSYGALTDDTIRSWYRFRVGETLAAKPPPFAITQPPSDMASPQNNEILMFKWGGTITVNGVSVTAEEPAFPNFTIGQRYLLVVQLDTNTKLVNNAMGVDGAYSLGANGQISSLNPNGGIFASDLAGRYGSSIDQLRVALNQ